MFNNIKKFIIGILILFTCINSYASENVLLGFSCQASDTNFPQIFSLVPIGDKRAVFVYSMPKYNVLWASVAKYEQIENNYVITEEAPSGLSFFEIVIYGVSEMRRGILNNFVINTIPKGKKQPISSRIGTCRPEFD